MPIINSGWQGGNWDGVMADVVNGRADIGIGTILDTSDRELDSAIIIIIVMIISTVLIILIMSIIVFMIVMIVIIINKSSWKAVLMIY